MSKSEMTIAWESFDEQSLKPALDQKIESVKAFGEKSRIYTEATTRLCSIAGFSAGWKAALKHADPIHAQLVEALRAITATMNDSAGGCLGCGRDPRRDHPLHDADCPYKTTAELLDEIDRLSPQPVAGVEAGK